MWPFCHNLRGGGEVTQIDGDVVVSDCDPISNVFNDLALLFDRQSGPPAVEVPGFCQDFVAGEVLDLEIIHLALQFGNLVIELLELLL